MVPQRNWEPPMNAHTGLCYSSDAGIKVSSHDPLWNYTDMLSSVPYFLEIIYVVCEVIKQHLSSSLDQKGIPLTCVVSFPLTLIVTTHTRSLYILCVKVEPWSFLVLEDSWLALKWRLIFPTAEMQEFVQLFSYLIHVFPNQVDDSSGMKKWMNNLTKWISTQMYDLLLANVNSQPLAYRGYWGDLLNVKSSSTSWFY
jgi:hypothetical protein